MAGQWYSTHYEYPVYLRMREPMQYGPTILIFGFFLCVVLFWIGQRIMRIFKQKTIILMASILDFFTQYDLFLDKKC
jgi:hypothetical protein